MDIEVVIKMSREDAESLRFDSDKGNSIFFGYAHGGDNWDFELVSIDGKEV